VLISSAGIRLLDLPVLPNQIAPARIVSSVPFTYVSEEKTRAAREQILKRVPPVYRLDAEPLHHFEGAARNLLARLAEYEASHPAQSVALMNRHSALAALADEFNTQGPYDLGADDLGLLLTAGDAATRMTLFETGFAALGEIYDEGVHDATIADAGEGSVTVFQVERATGGVSDRPVQSMEDALTFMRVSLASSNVPRPAAQALFRFFRNGVRPTWSLTARPPSAGRPRCCRD